MQCGTLRWIVRVTRLPVRAHKDRLMSKKRIGRAPDREFWLFAILTTRLYQNRYYCACLTRIYFIRRLSRSFREFHRPLYAFAMLIQVEDL